MRLLVTGITGFAGQVLAELLARAGHRLVGIAQRGGEGLARLCGAGRGWLDPAGVQLGDIADKDWVLATVRALAPEGIFHLAGLSHPGAAEADPARAYRVNFLGTLHLLEAAREAGCRILVVGSAEAYGAVREEELPATEDTPLRPVSTYGVSKAAADLAAHYWYWAKGVDVVRARPFNHTGPGQAPLFVCADLARQVAEIEASRRPPRLRVGNLEPVRDFCDVRDIAAGYMALWEKGRSGEVYNLCSGVGRRIGEVVELLRGMAQVPIEVQVDPGRRRVREVTRVVGSYVKAEQELGWHPHRQMEQTLAEMLAEWRRRVCAEATRVEPC